MQNLKQLGPWGRAASGLVLMLLLIGFADDARAQWVPKWLNVGDFQSKYFSGGSSPEADEVAWNYPGIRPNVGMNRWKGFWVSATNFTDESGRNWPVRISHIGPRFIGVGEVFDVSHTLTGKYEQTIVEVDGAETFAEPVVVDVVDPSLAPDRMVTSVINTSIGVTMERKAMQWSHPEHEMYHIIEYNFTNTGNVDRDDDIEAEQALEDVYFTFFDRPQGAGFAAAWDNTAGGVAWGEDTMNDAVGDGVSDYGVDFRAQFSWLANLKESHGVPFNTLGAPMWRNHQWNAIADDTLGRLGSPYFSGVVTIHADPEAHDPGVSLPDDPLQPRTMSYHNSDFGTISSGSDHNNEPKMAQERRYVECGASETPSGGIATIDDDTPYPCGIETSRVYPPQARLVMGDDASTPRDQIPDYANQTADVRRGGGGGGWGFFSSYGPYDMAPGQEVKIVLGEAAYGLNEEAAWQIGRDYKLSGWDDTMIHEFDADGDGVIEEDEAMTKNEWVITARDSLFLAFQRAIDNYRGGLNAPHPPPPPTSFTVTSGTDRITLEWSGSAPDGWEIWRAQKHYSGIMTALQVGSDGIGVPDEARKYQLIAELPGSATSYEDTDAVRGGSYFYYLQAKDASGLKSSRYYAQTYNPARLRRPAGESLSEVRVVPNPYHLGADPALRLDAQDRMAFFGLPGQARIDIFTELGELIRTIEHTDGSGDELWDMTTSSRQLVVSGVYIAVVTDTESGEEVILKFVVIR